ncbi:MAG: ECF transporter S component [Clostridia bacterium]|nr:ECF transporter S component [Clostridia bacterium]
MYNTVSLRSIFPAKRLAFTALFAALCLAATMLVVVPLPNGYFNTGDVFVLLAGWCLGPLYGSIAAAVGSALADICSGFALYAPATFFIKGLTALLCYYIWALVKKCIKKEALDFLPRLFSAVFAESAMVLGYFLFECILYGVGGAAVALLGNALQGACCGALAIAVCAAVYPLKGVRKLFPKLSDHK